MSVRALRSDKPFFFCTLPLAFQAAGKVQFVTSLFLPLFPFSEHIFPIFI